MTEDQRFTGAASGAAEGLSTKRHRGALWGDENVLYFDCEDVYIRIQVFVKTHQSAHLNGEAYHT